MTPQELHRQRYHIRHATPAELEHMDTDMRWHYEATAHKPFEQYFGDFRHEGKPVFPIGRTRKGELVLCPDLLGLKHDITEWIRPYEQSPT
jgi:hypothetical protein